MKITSSHVQFEAAIAPQSVAAAGTATSGWVDASKGDNLITVINGGALGGGSVALTFEQATDVIGTGAKAISGFTGGTVDDDNTQLVVDNNPSLLDHENGFRYVRAKLTVTGGSGSLVAGIIQVTSPRYMN